MRQGQNRNTKAVSREYGWKEAEGTEFISSSTLAERCVIRLMDLADSHARGEL
jgi:hypothetical protein